MPSIWSAIDTGFPKIDGQESTEKKLMAIQDYLFMLVEELGHTLRNLNFSKNFNKSQLNMFTEPIYASIGDAEGRLTELAITAEGIGARVSDAEGHITELSVTAQGLTTRVSNAEGNISQLSITAAGITTRVTSAEGSITSLTQTVYGFQLTASNGSTSSTLSLSSGGISLSSTTITFSGIVTFSSLSTAGQTTINGANITSGVITGATLRSIAPYSQVWVQNGGIDIYNGYGQHMGSLFYDSNGVPPDAVQRVYLWAQTLKIETSGNMSIEAGNEVFAKGSWRFGQAYVDFGTGTVDLRNATVLQ